jgi:hypothetical protein
VAAFAFFVTGVRTLDSSKGIKRNRFFGFHIASAIVCLLATGTFYDSIWTKVFLFFAIPYFCFVCYKTYYTDFIREVETDDRVRKAQELLRQFEAERPSDDGFLDSVFTDLVVPDYFLASMKAAALRLYHLDCTVIAELVTNPPSFIKMFEDLPTQERLNILMGTIRELFDGLYKPVAVIGPFSTPALELFPNPKEAVQWFAWRGRYNTHSDLPQPGPFTFIKYMLSENSLAASRPHLSVRAIEEGKRISPSEHPGDPFQVARAYLASTPFLDILLAPAPCGFPETQRLEHAVIVAGSGHGKTQALENIICSDLLSHDNPPGMVVIDSKADMVRRLAKLDIFNPDNGVRRDKLIIIDPRDGPALSPFDIGMERLERLQPEYIEEVVNGIISEMGYFFRSLLGADISGPMSGVFNPLVQLLVRIPGANLETMADAVDDPVPFIGRARELPDIIRRFLTTQYKELTARETRTAVKRRIYMLLTTSPSFARMFNATRNNLDLARALNDGTTVLVSTERNFLHDFSPLFGRYIISQAMSAARQRAPIPEKERKAAYIVVDEASDYFDERTELMLRTLRSYKVGSLMAFQDFGRVPATLQSAILANTSIRLAGGKVDDPKLAARLVNAEPEFVLAQQKVDNSHSEFACYVDRVTPRGISITIPHGTVDKQPQMTDEQYRRLRAVNRSRLSDYPPNRRDAPIDAEYRVVSEPPRIAHYPERGDSDDPTKWG